MATNTPNYNFKKPEGTDVVNIEDINSNMDLIDSALSPTADPAKAPVNNGPGRLKDWVGWFTNRIKAITGKPNWYDAPTKSLEQINNDVNSHLADTINAHGISGKVSKSGDTMTGPLKIVSSERPYLSPANDTALSGWSGGGMSVFGNNCYIDGYGKWRYLTTHPTAGAMAIWTQYNNHGKLYFMDTGQAPATTGVEFTPKNYEIMHQGNIASYRGIPLVEEYTSTSHGWTTKTFSLPVGTKTAYIVGYTRKFPSDHFILNLEHSDLSRAIYKFCPYGGTLVHRQHHNFTFSSADNEGAIFFEIRLDFIPDPYGIEIMAYVRTNQGIGVGLSGNIPVGAKTYNFRVGAEDAIGYCNYRIYAQTT